MLILPRDSFEGAEHYHERLKQALYDVRHDEFVALTPEQVNAALDATWDRMHELGFFAGL